MEFNSDYCTFFWRCVGIFGSRVEICLSSSWSWLKICELIRSLSLNGDEGEPSGVGTNYIKDPDPMRPKVTIYLVRAAERI